MSIGIAVLASIPRFIRLESSDLANFLLAILYTFVHAFSCWLIHQYFLNNHRLLLFRRSWAIGAISVGSSLLLYLLLEQAIHLFFSYTIIWTNIPPLRRLLWLLMRGSVLSAFVFFVAYYLKLNRASQAARLENERLKQENLRATLDVLKQQISPHFLFNSLNTLKSLSHEETVKTFTIQLANVYRYMLSYTNTDVVPVKDELAFTEAYLSIQQARFGNSLRCEVSVTPSLYYSNTLPFVVQLLIENAIKHNTATHTRPLLIRIFNEENFLVVTNNRQPKYAVESSTGLGLANIQLRYEMIAHQKIEIITDESSWTVKVPLLAP